MGIVKNPLVVHFILIAVLLAPVPSTGHDRVFNATVLKLVRGDVSRYPSIKLDVVAMSEGNSVVVGGTISDSLIRVTEEGTGCKIADWKKSSDPLRCALDVIVDLNAVTWQELQVLQQVVLAMKQHPGFRFEHHFYCQGSVDTLVEMSVNDFYRHKLELTDSHPLATGTIEHFFASHRQWFGEGDHCILLVLESLSRETLGRLTNSLSAGAGNGTLWYGFLVADGAVDGDQFPRRNSVLFAEAAAVSPAKLVQEVTGVLDRIAGCHIEIRVESSNTQSRAKERAYEIIMPAPQAEGSGSGDGRIHGTWSMTIPEQLVDSTFIRTAVEVASDLASRREFGRALDTLHTACRVLDDSSLESLARTIIKRYGDWLLSEGQATTSEDLVRRAEGVWHLTSDEEPWYRMLKYYLRKRHFDMLPQSDSTLDERARLADELAQLYPENILNVIRACSLMGESLAKQGEYWRAAKSYARGLSFKHDNTMAQHLQEALKSAIDADYASGNLIQLHGNAKEYQALFSGYFSLRFFFAKSCIAARDFATAADNFEWLIFNWDSSQNLVAWEDAFAQLQRLFSMTMRFDDAFRLNQRVYRQTGQAEALTQSVMNLRAGYIAPAVSAFAVFWTRVVTRSERNQFFRKNASSVWPHFFHNFVVMDTTASVSYCMVERKRSELPDQSQLMGLSEFPAIMDALPKQKAIWLIQGLVNGYAIAEIATALDDEELALMVEVQKNGMLEEPWRKLAEHEQKVCARMLTELLGRMFSIEYAARGYLNVTTYWNVLKTSQRLVYVVQHGKDGGLLSRASFDARLCQSDPELWQRSTRTLAYMTQDVLYQDTQVLDAAYPLYVNGTWEGVFRIGLRKY